MANYKVVLVGDGGVGKTTFIKRHLTGEFEPKYLATLGVEVHPLGFNTTNGKIEFNVWDTAGQEKFGGLRDGYYINADACIVFGDVTSRVTFENMKQWVTDVKRVRPNCIFVYVGNKCDINNRRVTGMKNMSITYFDISAKSNYQFEKPFEYLAQQLLKDDNIRFIANEIVDVVVPPTVGGCDYLRDNPSRLCPKNKSFQKTDPRCLEHQVEDMSSVIKDLYRDIRINNPEYSNELIKEEMRKMFEKTLIETA